jgi:hypothetical protein
VILGGSGKNWDSVTDWGEGLRELKTGQSRAAGN